LSKLSDIFSDSSTSSRYAFCISFDAVFIKSSNSSSKTVLFLLMT
jgi:hypothetical protein